MISYLLHSHKQIEQNTEADAYKLDELMFGSNAKATPSRSSADGTKAIEYSQANAQHTLCVIQMDVKM